MLPEIAWKATLGELELQMTKATFNTWLKDTRLLSCDDGEYVVGVKNDYAKDWLENRLQGAILRTLNAIVDEQVHVRFVVGAAAPQEVRPQNGVYTTAVSSGKVNGKITPEATMELNGTSLGEKMHERYTFSTFVVGPSNRLAHAAALSVAENPGQTYNPLFIYGGVGLGKTHLLQALGQKCQGDGYTVCYITSEMFTNDLVQSIRNKQMAHFRERYRTPDVLMIDDIQFIAGKESTQEELFHTFNEIHSQGKQVVISSDRPPKAMATLEERLQSRFEWGLMADIQLPDVETRKAILQAKAEEIGLDVPDQVIEFVARHVRNNIRELEGALNKAMAYARLSGGCIDMELVNMALADLVRTPDNMTVDQVIEAVCRYYNVAAADLVSDSRKRAIVFPRHIAMYLSRTETDASLPQIGKRLGNRDHTTVLYGYEKIASLLESDAMARRDTLEIKASMYEANSA